MKRSIRLGVLAFHGDVVEHIYTSRTAAKILHLSVEITEVRTKAQVNGIDGLILPGGESTTLHKLCIREGMWNDLHNVPCIFGTCAGAILISKTILHKTDEQDSLKRIDIEIDRNAYGRQSDSFEKEVTTTLGMVNAIFIRAPRILSIGKKVKVLAKNDDEIIACEETNLARYALASTFHPELSSTLFHEYFLKKIADRM